MLITCGGLRTDYIITHRGEIRLMQMGGNALFSALGARLWLNRPNEIMLLARIGDNYPKGWLEDLQRTGLGIAGVRNVGGKQDLRTFYAYLDENTRVDTHPAAHFAQLGLPIPPELAGYINSTPGQDDVRRYEPLAVTPEDLDMLCEKLAGELSSQTDVTTAQNQVLRTSGLHIAPISIRTQQDLPAAARNLGISVISVDPGERTMVPALRPHIEQVLGQIDIFMPSDQEVNTLFPDADMDINECARWFADRGPGIVVIKLGTDGVYVYQRRDERAWHVPALAVRAIDVTGAGDSFCGGFMADFMTHGDPVRAAVTGTVSASFAVQDYGALHMLATPETEIDHRAAYLQGLVREV